MESSDSESPVRRGWQPQIRSYGGFFTVSVVADHPFVGSTKGPDGYSEWSETGNRSALETLKHPLAFCKKWVAHHRLLRITNECG